MWKKFGIYNWKKINNFLQEIMDNFKDSLKSKKSPNNLTVQYMMH